jgi:hypothetical protein
MANEQQTKKPQQQQPERLPNEPPRVVQAPPMHDYLQQCDSYLESKGWEKMGSNEYGVGLWQDPIGSNQRAEPTTVIELPAKGGGTETIRQMTGPPLSWIYTTYEAMCHQRERDRFGNAQTPLERLAALEAKYNKLDTIHQQYVARMEEIVAKPLPEKKEAMLAYRGLLIEALGKAKVALAEPVVKSQTAA